MIATCVIVVLLGLIGLTGWLLVEAGKRNKEK